MGDSSEKELERRIFAGEFDFEDENFEYISAACKDLIVRMLVVDPAVRITVDQILAHSWITHEAPEQTLLTAPQKLKPLVKVCVLAMVSVLGYPPHRYVCTTSTEI